MLANPSPIAARIAARMRSRGLSLNALARAAGVSKGRLSELLSGKQQTLRAETLTRLAQALGWTVGEMMGEAPAADGIVALRHEEIEPSPLNPRRTFDPETLHALAGSILQDGLLQNLVVRRKPDGDGYWLVAGERRWRAIGLLIHDGDWPADRPIPCRVQEIDDVQHRALAIIENLQRDEVPAIEEAEAFQALIDLGWTTARIAEEIHTTQRHVQLRLALLTKAAPEVQDALRDGRISLAQARVMTTAPAEAQRKVLKKIEAGKGKRERAEDVHRALQAELRGDTARQEPAEEHALRSSVATDDEMALRLTVYGALAEHAHGTVLVIGGLRPRGRAFALLGHDISGLVASAPHRPGSIVWRRDRLADAWRLIEKMPIAELRRIWSDMVADSLILSGSTADPALAALRRAYGGAHV